MLESTDNTQRAELAERQAQELRRELEAERRKAAKAHELAELYRSGRDQAIDELRAIQPQGATAWSADSRGLAVRLDELEGLEEIGA